MAAPIRRVIACRRTINSLRTLRFDTLAERYLSCSAPRSQQWQLWSAVCLERLPVISAKLNTIEEKYSDLLSALELENSKLSDHELRHLEDSRLLERRKQEDYEETEAEAIRQTALEAEDAWESELHKFTPASRITEEDRTGDLKSTNHQLDRKLILLVKQKLGDECHWIMPQLPREEGQSMRQAAEKTLTSLCGDGLNVQFMGNAPCGFFKYSYPPKPELQGFKGAKVFFFKASHHSGQVDCQSSTATDHVWVTADQLPEYLNPEYHRAVTKFILDL